MSDAPADGLTRLLLAARGGDVEAWGDAFERVYAELRRLADGHLRKEATPGSLQPTVLVHEAYLRLVPEEGARSQFETRRAFFGAASNAMRRILVDRARRRLSEKGGGGRRAVTFFDLGVEAEEDRVDVLSLDEALASLERRSPELAEVVRLRFFGGLSPEGIAEQLGSSVRTVGRQWRFARAWLYERMGAEG